MKFLIEGREYDLKNGIAKATLYTLFELKSRYGIGMKSLVGSAKKMESLTDPMELLEDEASFKVFMALIWLARRYAGEKLTLEEANNVSLDDFTVEPEEGDEVPEDPKAVMDSDPEEQPNPPTTI